MQKTKEGSTGRRGLSRADFHRLRKFPPWGEVSSANVSQRACVMKGEMGPVYLAKGNDKCG